MAGTSMALNWELFVVVEALNIRDILRGEKKLMLHT